MKLYDHIIVGSGINSLVCAAILAKKGRAVLILERNDRLGCTRLRRADAAGQSWTLRGVVCRLLVPNKDKHGAAEEVNQDPPWDPRWHGEDAKPTLRGHANL